MQTPKSKAPSKSKKTFRGRKNRGPVAPDRSRCDSDTASATPRLSHSPHSPWPKQQLFLELKCLEAFYGGAAGGGKSDALLMAALQFVHVPGYSALILRKDTQRLRLAGGLIPRSHEWLTGTDARWNDTERCWKFSTSGAPATIRFGYLRDPFDKYRYASSEFQFIGFDELTEMAEEDYLFLFSRLRRTKTMPVPLRMRSASNPGGVGHAWVKKRFLPSDFRLGPDLPEVLWQDERACVRATIDDNPALDAEEYRKSLAHLPPVMRQRLMHGDWAIREDALLRADWLRYYREQGEQLVLLAEDGQTLARVTSNQTRRFVTVDPAGTSADRAREKQGRSPCATAIQVWDQIPERPFPALILRKATRGLLGFDQLCHELRNVHREWRPERIWIENEKLGQAAVDVLRNEIPIATIPTRGQDKVTRASWLITRLERGEIFLPSEPLPWRLDFEGELLGWTGHPHDHCDQVDAAAYAAIVATRSSIRSIRLSGETSIIGGARNSLRPLAR